MTHTQVAAELSGKAGITKYKPRPDALDELAMLVMRELKPEDRSACPASASSSANPYRASGATPPLANRSKFRPARG
jgi:hypothetical protein